MALVFWGYGETYNVPFSLSSQKSLQVDQTESNFMLNAGNMASNIDGGWFAFGLPLRPCQDI